MADDIDVAAERSESERHRFIAARVRFVGESAHECRECGNDIPELRRKALPGIQICVECAAALEAQTRQFSRH
ncbi:MAG: hypothetical protein BWK73_19095 [Thiothrix lacustris]|uniref:Zinc finger DksA/TraR C4-type domain-containing protein n=1 Tax=Thiothrix lacustris TaxID=525917 RepID=A0A1Y1QPN4_9GAMM|nr:MAG: hypothetical protein BWK73_19095 [Thiothrix lacustris]